MKIKKISVATLVPAAAVGITVSSLVAVQAATGHPSAHAAAHRVRELGPRAARHAAHVSAHKQVSRARTASSGRDRARHGAQAKAGHRAHAKAAASPAAQPPAPSSSSPPSGMSAFEQCVAWRESGDNPAASSAGLFGILPSTWSSLGYPGTAGEASVATQKAAFDRLYAQYGTSPWASYDGC